LILQRVAQLIELCERSEQEAAEPARFPERVHAFPDERWFCGFLLLPQHGPLGRATHLW